MVSVYDFEVKKPNGDTLSLKEYEGKPLVIVNTASKCGLTPQFSGLQSLFEKYKEDGLMILDFPCDQFNDQEFDNIDETTEFCQLNYGVTFPIMAKINVNGDEADPLFNHLTSEKKGMLSKKVRWNFTKFLVDRDGKVVERYAPQTAPEKLAEDVEKLL
ncbi:glutathione peroxidase [Sporosarcina sp. FA9]|uniref:glutathione peroxidase n=1 Tax=Sporosarcina sp. FA9 TaxID=3413030 RepID=UPI003F660A60